MQSWVNGFLASNMQQPCLLLYACLIAVLASCRFCRRFVASAFCFLLASLRVCFDSLHVRVCLCWAFFRCANLSACSEEFPPLTYQLLEKMGQRGFGSVFKARLATGEDVAIKMALERWTLGLLLFCFFGGVFFRRVGFFGVGCIFKWLKNASWRAASMERQTSLSWARRSRDGTWRATFDRCPPNSGTGVANSRGGGLPPHARGHTPRPQTRQLRLRMQAGGEQGVPYRPGHCSACWARSEGVCWVALLLFEGGPQIAFPYLSGHGQREPCFCGLAASCCWFFVVVVAVVVVWLFGCWLFLVVGCLLFVCWLFIVRCSLFHKCAKNEIQTRATKQRSRSPKRAFSTRLSKQMKKKSHTLPLHVKSRSDYCRNSVRACGQSKCHGRRTVLLP